MIDQSTTKPAPALKSIDIFDKGGLMENAYKYVENEKYASILKQAKGIGTSATRDKAIASLEDKKYIITDKDDYVHITGNGWIMDSICKNLDFSNALLTAEWEEKYKEIGKGTVQAFTLVDETEEMIVKSMKSINDNWNAKELLARYQEEKQNADKESGLGECPACKNGYVIKEKFTSKKDGKQYTIYKCDNPECDFAVFQNYFEAKFTDTDIKNMLAGKNSRKIKLTSKAGKTYQASFHLEQDSATGKWKVALMKDPNWGKKTTYEREEELGPCPACGQGTVARVEFDSNKNGKTKHYTVYKCDNKDCDFIIFQDYFDAKFDDDDMINMLAGGKSKKLKLKTKTGYAYEAAFRLEPISDSGKWHVAMIKEFTRGRINARS